MKKQTLILFLIFITQLSFGQSQNEIPDSNATWCMDITTLGFGPPYPPPISHMLKYFESKGDTQINNSAYKIIQTSIYPGRVYLRENDKKIFCKYKEGLGIDTSEFLLYDFNVNVGDTVYLPRGSNNILQNLFPGIVEAKDSILIGGINRLHIRLTSWIIIDWVEGIGSLQGLLYNEIPFVDYGGELVCFSINDTILSLNEFTTNSFGNCLNYTEIKQIDNEDNNVVICKINNELNIKFEELKFIKIYNILGVILKESNTNKINISNLSQGYYVIIIGNKNKIITRKYLIE